MHSYRHEWAILSGYSCGVIYALLLSWMAKSGLWTKKALDLVVECAWCGTINEDLLLLTSSSSRAYTLLSLIFPFYFCSI